MYYYITAVVFLVMGFIISYFVMRNNPKYFNIDKMAKNERDIFLAKLKEKI